MGLGILDIVLLTLSMVVSGVIGLYQGYKGRRATPESYLMGSRKMRPIPLAMSMMVGTVSAITIMGNAGEMYAYGTQLMMMDLGMLLALFVIAKVMIPIIHPMGVVSLYEYIEKRFRSRWLRQATVVLQLVGGYFFMGFLLYPPSLALQAFTGLSIMLNIFIMGATCTIYSSFGGVKAVVYTDVFQALVMVAGVAAIVILGSNNAGGLDHVWDIAYHHGRTDLFNLSLDPYQRHSFWLCVTMGFYFAMGTYGVNQSQTQRYFSTRTIKEGQKVLYYAAGGMVLLRVLIHLSGLAIFAKFYKCDVLGNQDPAYVVVIYVLTVLTSVPGLAGIFVASVYAATLSSVSTQLNAMTALLWADFLKPLPLFASWNEVKAGTLQKLIVLLSGVVAVVLGLVVSLLGKSFLRALLTINGSLSGPLIGLFIVALCLPWVKLQGAAAGFIVSIILSVWLAIGQLLYQEKEPYLPISSDTCQAATANTTINDTTTEGDLPEDSSVHAIYGLSYCLNSFLGTVFCIVVALLATACTGANTPDDVEERLVYDRAWKVFTRCSDGRGAMDCIKSIFRRKEETMEMAEAVEKEPLPSDVEQLNADGETRGAV